jgi:4-coumarate--CoA ligase
MPVKSRWTTTVENCSLQKWIFGSSFDPLPDRKAFYDADKPDTHFLTFADYRSVSKQVALGLQAVGLKPGDRVLLFSTNNLYTPVIFLGILMAGGIFTGANPAMVARELSYQLENSGAKYMVAGDPFLDVALDAAKIVGMPPKNVFLFDTTIPGSARPEKPARKGTRHWTELLAPKAKAAKFDWVEPADSRNATCCLNYSSGTTGLPKGVEISHYSYVANGTNVVMVDDMQPDFEAKRARTVTLCFLPLYHAYGQTYFLANFAKIGVPIYIMPVFDFEKMLAHIANHRVTQLVTVPPILVLLSKHPLARKADLSSLEQVGCGAAPLSADTAKEVEHLLPRKDIIVRQGWGMTELTCTAMTWDANRQERGASVGELMPNCQAKIMELDAKTEITKANAPGELWISGPTVMKGYWKNPKATKETVVLDADGTRWLRTGDIGYVTNYEAGGLFYIVDRLKELIKVKGNQVAPAELEALLLELPDVMDAAVVGVTIKGEERPRAYIVKSPSSKVTGEEIAKWLEERVTKYKRLRGGVAFTDVIPKNPVSYAERHLGQLLMRDTNID